MSASFFAMSGDARRRRQQDQARLSVCVRWETVQKQKRQNTQPRHYDVSYNVYELASICT
jgi:hypothetical protein